MVENKVAPFLPDTVYIKTIDKNVLLTSLSRDFSVSGQLPLVDSARRFASTVVSRS